MGMATFPLRSAMLSRQKTILGQWQGSPVLGLNTFDMRYWRSEMTLTPLPAHLFVLAQNDLKRSGKSLEQRYRRNSQMAAGNAGQAAGTLRVRCVWSTRY